MKDPRGAQIAVLSALAVWGATALDFGVTWERAAVTIGAALGVQALGNAWRGERFEPRSALISALSLILLLRTAHVGWAAAAAAIAVGSKFVLRARGRHVFNPTNLAIVALLLLDAAWVSSGQWGSGVVAAASLAAAALWVLPRVRGDVTLAFAAIWSALLLGRALWLGDPLEIPLHQLSSGTLFVFAAFMLSDPRTIPNARAGRILFAALVALGGYVGRFLLYEPNALLYSLAAAALLVPLIDRWLPGRAFRWPGASDPPPKKKKENPDDRLPLAAAPALRLHAAHALRSSAPRGFAR